MMKPAWGQLSGSRHNARLVWNSQRPKQCHLQSLGRSLRRCSVAQHNKSLLRPALRSWSTTLAPEEDAIAFCLDSAIADLSYLTIFVAYNAAQELWPDRVVGPVSLYVEKARSILPALAEPHHAVVLVRLLADEGVIGARSTAGREGPVVGRAVRNTGSRPLLVAEIAEHWPVVMDSCLLRWSLEGGGWPQALHSSSSSSGSRAAGSGPDGRGSMGSSSSSSSSSGSRSSRDQLLAQAREAFRAAQATLLDDPQAVEDCMSRIIPYSTAVEALKGCSRAPLIVTSTLPADLGLRVLDRCGLAALAAEAAAAEAVAQPLFPGLDLVCEPSWAGVVARLVGRAAAGGGRVQLVTGNLARLEQLVEEEGWRGPEGERAGNEGGSSSSRGGSPPPAVRAAETTAAAAAGVAEEAGPVAATGRAGGLRTGGWVLASAAAEEEVRAAASGKDSGEGRCGSAAEVSQRATCPSCSCSGVDRGPADDLAVHSTSSGVGQPAEAAPLSSSQVVDAEAAGVWRRLSADAGCAAATAAVTAAAAAPGGSAPADAAVQQHRQLGAAVGGSTSSSTAAEVQWTTAALWWSPPPDGDGAGELCSRADGSGPSGAGEPCIGGDDGDCVSSSSSRIGGDEAGGAGDYDDERYERGREPWSPWRTLRRVHLAEWSCASVSFRARALSYRPRASLLSEHQLAEWLGVTHLDVVMDGVAWR